MYDLQPKCKAVKFNLTGEFIYWNLICPAHGWVNLLFVFIIDIIVLKFSKLIVKVRG